MVANRVQLLDLSFVTLPLSMLTAIMQLFRQRWLPATWNAPRTVFTFEFLNTFHLLNLQSKCNLYDYYHATLRQTNNADLQHQPVCPVLFLPDRV
jgi:hypothetical protein